MLLFLFFFPLVASLVVLLFGKSLSKLLSLAFTSVLFFATVYFFISQKQNIILAEVNYPWVTKLNLYFHLVADGFSIWMILLTNFLLPLIVLSTFRKDIERSNVFYSLMLLMQFGLNGVFLAADGFLFYVFWELALIPIYFIVWLWSDNPIKEISSRVAFKFFVYTIAGSLFMLFAFMYLYAYNGTLSVESLYNLNLTENEQIFLFLCIFIAFAVKIPVFPFHTWQADTYKEAPTAGTMLLSGIMLKMGIYALIRWLIPVFPLGLQFWSPYILVLCVIGIIYGAIIAIKQDNLKNLLAFSSLSHVGLIAAGTFILTKEGLQGSLVQMLAHGVNVFGMFYIAEIILSRTSTLSIAQLGGIRNVAPKFFTFTLILTLAAVGLPTTNAFIGEFLLLFSMFQYNTYLAIAAGFTIILGAVYMFRMVQNTFLGPINLRTQSFTDLYATEIFIFVVLTITIFTFGLFPNLVFETASPIFDKILQTALR